MKQIIDLPTSTSTINQSDMNVSNAIYRITQDYDLNSKTIKIPQDCVLSFEGGSLNNGVLVGQSTIIKDNQFDGFFKSNLDLTGDYSVMKVIANWFDEIEAYKMFQRAFDFAFSIFEARKTYYSSSSILVTCFAKSYYISKGMRIRVGVSFNGNNASFFPKNDTWKKDDYMFRLNIKRDNDDDWEIAYPGNIYEEFCHVNYSNPDNILCHFMLGGDSRFIHDIYAFRPAFFYKQIDRYEDSKHFCNITIAGNNNSFPLDFQNPKTYRIQWYLGDAAEINHISDGASIFIYGGANAVIRNSINSYVYISGCRNILLESFHNEYGSILADHSSLILKNMYFYAQPEGNIFFKGDYNVGSELFLENLFFGYLTKLDNFNSYYPIVNLSTFENSRISIKNVYGLINDGGNGHNFGNAILLKYKNNYTQESHYLNPNGEIINTGKVVNSFKYFDSNTILPLKWDAGTGNQKAYIKVIYIADEERKLKLSGNLLADDENIVQSIDNTFSFRATMYDTGRTIQQLTK